MADKNPKWLDNAIFYEIYPQSFCDSNGDGIGDFNGIIQKLDYIKELGCNAIWMNPCFASPFGDAGYDVSDYYLAAPRYGTNEDLRRLFIEVHKRGMHILLDLVPGHTSTEHKWFKESMKACKNEYTDRYVWTDSIWVEPDGMASLRGISDRDGSCAVNFFSHQPALNYGFYKPDPAKKWQQPMDAPGPKATLEELKNIMRFWLGMGCDGFRVDMAGSLVKHDENGKGTIKLWQNVRGFLDKEFPEAAMVSEWGEPDKSLQGGFHMDFLLHFGPSHYNDLFRCENPFFAASGKGDVFEFVEKYKESYEKARANPERMGLICIPSGNHDMDRLACHIKGDNLKLAFAFLLSMPGAPFIYYGDEIGMNYVENLVSVEGGYGRTGSRSPMQWDSSTNAGFSSAPAEKLYIPLDPNSKRPTVQAQQQNKKSLYHEIQKLIKIRQEHEALQSRGEIEFVFAKKNEYPLAYVRSCEKCEASGANSPIESTGKKQCGEKILVIINPSEKEVAFSCDLKKLGVGAGTGTETETEACGLENAIYTFGGKITFDGKKIFVAGKSAGFFKLN